MSLHPFDQLSELSRSPVQQEPTRIHEAHLSVEPGGRGGVELTPAQAREAFEGLFLKLLERQENTRIVEAFRKAGRHE